MYISLVVYFLPAHSRQVSFYFYSEDILNEDTKWLTLQLMLSGTRVPVQSSPIFALNRSTWPDLNLAQQGCKRPLAIHPFTRPIFTHMYIITILSRRRQSLHYIMLSWMIRHCKKKVIPAWTLPQLTLELKHLSLYQNLAHTGAKAPFSWRNLRSQLSWST
jgi:hypothetical protein